MGDVCILTEQGEDSLGFLGSLNEEDQNRYNDQTKKEETDMRKKAGEPTK